MDTPTKAIGYHLVFRKKLLDTSIENDYEIAKEKWRHNGRIIPSDDLKNHNEHTIKMLYDVDDFIEIDRNGYGRCICEHPIYYHCMIVNDSAKCKLFIGNCCVKHIGNKQLNEEYIKILQAVITDLQNFKKMSGDGDEFVFLLPSKDTIEYALEFDHILREDADFIYSLARVYKRKEYIKLSLDEMNRVVRIWLKLVSNISKQVTNLNEVTASVVKKLVLTNTNINLIKEFYEEVVEECPQHYFKFYFDEKLKIGVHYPNINGLNRKRYALQSIEFHDEARNIFKLNWTDITRVANKSNMGYQRFSDNSIAALQVEHFWDSKEHGEYKCAKCGIMKYYDITKFTVTPMLPPLCKTCACSD